MRPRSALMVTVKPPQPLELLPMLLLALAPGLASGALVFEAANQVFNFPGAPRSDPVSWGFPAEDARTAMALAGSVSGGAWAGSTDGGSSWTRTHIEVPEALSVAVGGSDRQTRMAVTGNGVPNGWTGAVVQGPFKTSSHLLVHADPTSRTFSASVNSAAAAQITWGKLPAPTVIFAPSSGGVTRFPDGMLLATVFVWFVPPVTADGHKAVMGQPWFPHVAPNPGIRPCACPGKNHTCSACPIWGQCCNNSIVSYISNDNGSTFEYRGKSSTHKNLWAVGVLR